MSSWLISPPRRIVLDDLYAALEAVERRVDAAFPPAAEQPRRLDCALDTLRAALDKHADALLSADSASQQLEAIHAQQVRMTTLLEQLFDLAAATKAETRCRASAPAKSADKPAGNGQPTLPPWITVHETSQSCAVFVEHEGRRVRLGPAAHAAILRLLYERPAVSATLTERDANVHLLREHGVSLRVIADVLAMTERAVRNALNRQGSPRPGPGHDAPAGERDAQ